MKNLVIMLMLTVSVTLMTSCQKETPQPNLIEKSVEQDTLSIDSTARNIKMFFDFIDDSTNMASSVQFSLLDNTTLQQIPDLYWIFDGYSDTLTTFYNCHVSDTITYSIHLQPSQGGTYPQTIKFKYHIINDIDTTFYNIDTTFYNSQTIWSIQQYIVQ